MASPSPCPQAISADNARRLYDALKDYQGDCKLEEVRTESDLMRVEWKKDGVSAPLVTVQPRVCAEGATLTGPEFALTVPPGAAEQCPGAVERMKALIGSERFGGAIQLGERKGSVRWETYAPIAGAGLLLVLVGILIWRRR
jgi:hypothetical protein